MGDHAILDDERKALTALAHAPSRGIHFKTQRGGHFAIAIGEHGDLAISMLRLAPSIHDKHVVHGHEGNRVHTLRLDGVDVVHKARQVARAAGGREGARHRHQDDGLAGQQLLGAELGRAISGHGREVPCGDTVTNLNRHVRLLGSG